MALALPAGAAPAEAKPGKKTAAPVADPAASVPVASTSVFAWTSTAPLTVEAVTSQFELFDRELLSLTSRFSQHLTMLETGMATDADGTVTYLKPERLRIERSKPERQTIVFDGKDIWVYLPLRPQAIQLSMEDLKNSDPLASSLLQFGSYAKMLKTYDVALDSAAGRPQLVLRPKGKTVDFTLRFQLDPETLFPARTELAVEGMRIDSTFADYRFNPRVDEGVFKFTPPAGTEVIRNLKPPRMSP